MTHRNVIRNPAREQITAAIKAALEAAPNRSELARQIGVSRKQTYEWESGNNTPSLETLAAIAEATGVPIVLAFGPEPDTTKDAAPDIPERLDLIYSLLRLTAQKVKVDPRLVAEIEAARRDALDAEHDGQQRDGQHQKVDVRPQDG